MSYYSYYQQQPQWGTAGYQIVAPPRPYFQPQANWGGRQYFQAQVGGLSPDGYDDVRDEGFFESVFRGLKDVFSRGFAREDAQLWHRRVYGGQVPVDELDAAQIGAAAGFEAIRHWQMYGSTYRSPFGDNHDREKEGLAGLAAGEAVKLLSYSQRRRSGVTRRDAAEVAAATAERIYTEDYDDPYDAYESNPYRRRRRGSMGGRRRSSSFYERERPLIGSTTGGYVSAQPTGASYVSAGTPGASYVSAGTPGVQYVQAGTTGGYMSAQPGYAQTGYVSATTGQPVQYVQAGSAYGTQSPYGQPTTPYGQATIISGGQPVQYGTPGVQYATTGQPYQQAYMTGGTQYVQSTGYTTAQPTGYATAQPQYVTGQSTGYLGAPQGYGRVRSLSTGGYAQAPQVLYR